MKAITSLGVALAAVTLLTAADWPGFRGNRGGAADDADLPVRWTKDDFVWKVKLPGPGASSPVVAGGKVFLTAYAGYGLRITKGFGDKAAFGKAATDAGDPKDLRLYVLCYDAGTGKELWKKEVAPKLPESPFANFLREHGYASSTPATDGERLYVFFGKTGVFAFDLQGNELWQADVGFGTHEWGSASSPALTKDLVVVNASIESQSLVALDKRTGKEAWRVPKVWTSWTSPLVVTTKDGKEEIVFSAPGKVSAYDPADGKELWHCQGIGEANTGYTIATPVARGDIVYVAGGGAPGTPPATLAVRAGGRGDVTKTHVLWRAKAGTGISSPVLSGDHLCLVNGTATCLNVADGKPAFTERLNDARGEYVSPVAAGGKVYALTRFNGLYVIAGGAKFEQLAHNTFDDDASVFNASPAISDGRLYLRSNEYLYCVGKK